MSFSRRRESNKYLSMKSIGNHFLLLGLWASQASAQTSGGGALQDPLGGKTFQQVVDSITSGLLTVATPVVAIMVIVGGFMIMTAGGNSEKVTTGRNAILYAVIGYAVLLFAKVVVSILKDLLKA
jgi:hypothetical protein